MTSNAIYANHSSLNQSREKRISMNPYSPFQLRIDRYLFSLLYPFQLVQGQQACANFAKLDTFHKKDIVDLNVSLCAMCFNRSVSSKIY